MIANHTGLTLFVILIIFLCGCIGGAIPYLIRHYNKAEIWLLYGDAFAKGIFLGAGLIHLLPDAVEDLSQNLPTINYPLTFLICSASIFLIQFLEQGLKHVFQINKSQPHIWISYLLLTLLSIHSLITGVALGIATEFGVFITLTIAILAHKGTAAFALANNMQKNHITGKKAIQLILLFSVMTPIGIVFGDIINLYLHTQLGNILQGVFNAIAAGTFIYIASFSQLEHEGIQKHISSWSQYGFFGLGIVVMAIEALWL